ncbi:MAG: hypothetical protein GY778_23690 [bacterium]|nr:hypothetical protein [bacterium]
MVLLTCTIVVLPAAAQTIDDWDDNFDGTALDPFWSPGGNVGVYSFEVSGGSLHVTVPGSISQGSPGAVASFLRSGPPHALYPEWWADLRLSHNLLRGLRHGAAGWFLAGLGGFLAPERLANPGFDGVFASSSSTFIPGDDNPTAQSNPIILRIHKKPDLSLEVWYKADSDPEFMALFNNPIDISYLATDSPDVNLLIDARDFVIGGATADVDVYIDYVDFTAGTPPDAVPKQVLVDASVDLGAFANVVANDLPRRLVEQGLPVQRTDLLRHGGMLHTGPLSVVVTVGPGGELSYDWTPMTTGFGNWHRLGREHLAVLAYMPEALADMANVAPWAWQVLALRAAPPLDYGQWAEMTFEAVRHYNFDNPWRHEYWEVWNEPNATGFWAVSWEEYLQLYDVAAVQIKAADPTAKVGGPVVTIAGSHTGVAYLPGPSEHPQHDPVAWNNTPVWTDARHESTYAVIWDFIEHCGSNGIPLDFLVWHNYNHNMEPYVDRWDVRTFKTHADLFRAWLSEYPALAGAELIVDEWGFLGVDPDPAVAMFQSAYTAAAVTEMIHAGVRCNPAAWFPATVSGTDHPTPQLNAHNLFAPLGADGLLGTSTGGDEYIRVAATRNGEEGVINVLFSNFHWDSPQPVDAAFLVECLNLPQPIKYEVWLLDSTHSNYYENPNEALFEMTEQGTVPVGENTLDLGPVTLEAYAAGLLRIVSDAPSNDDYFNWSTLDPVWTASALVGDPLIALNQDLGWLALGVDTSVGGNRATITRPAPSGDWTVETRMAHVPDYDQGHFRGRAGLKIIGQNGSEVILAAYASSIGRGVYAGATTGSEVWESGFNDNEGIELRMVKAGSSVTTYLKRPTDAGFVPFGSAYDLTALTEPYDLALFRSYEYASGQPGTTSTHFDYLTVTPATPPLTGDFDEDGDVDGFDYAFLAGCFAGPGTAPSFGCEPCDVDADIDVDLADVGAFQVAFTGSQ